MEKTEEKKLNIFQKLQKVRCEVNKKCTKKTGKNQYFTYFQLEDFLGVANEEFNKLGMTTIFTIENEILSESISEDMNGNKHQSFKQIEMAYLRVLDGENMIAFKVPTANAILNSKNPIQELGAKITYLKRYLYLNALELSEGDIVDASHEEKPKAINKVTESQLQFIQQLAKDKGGWLKSYLMKEKIASLNDLTVEQASKLIGMLKDE